MNADDQVVDGFGERPLVKVLDQLKLKHKHKKAMKLLKKLLSLEDEWKAAVCQCSTTKVCKWCKLWNKTYDLLYLED